MKFARNGLDAELKFATGAKLDKAQLRGAKKLVELLARDALSECGLTIEDKARAPARPGWRSPARTVAPDSRKPGCTRPLH